MFALSSPLGGADADVIADGVLIDFKASRARSVVSSTDIYQLVGYALADLYDWYGIRSVGIHALRWRKRWIISLEDLLRRLSGTDRPSPQERSQLTTHTSPWCYGVARRHEGAEAACTRCDWVLALAMTRSSPRSRESWPCRALLGQDAILIPATARGARLAPEGPGVRSPTNREVREPATTVIDRIRQDIQERLEQLLAEADKLRRALVALDPRERSIPPRAKRAKPRLASKEPARKPSSPKTVSPKPTAAQTRTRTESPPARAARGATKAKVLGALSSDEALTAGEVAKATRLGRATVSTTLSKLAKSGEIAKAERGYRIPPN